MRAQHWIPWLPLLLCLGAAAAMLWSGLRLGIREETRRTVPDREPLKAFAATLQRECFRLERLYESHLRRIAGTTSLDDDFQIRNDCGGIEGIAQFSVLHPGAASKADRHIRITPRTSGPDPASVPQPYIEGSNRSDNPSQFPVAIPPGVDSGWIDAPGQPTMFWIAMGDEQTVAFHIDRERLQMVADSWLMAELGESFVSGGHAAVLVPSGRWSRGDAFNIPERTPDFLVPVPSRFGTWEVASWDQFDSVAVQDIPLLAGAAGLAVMLVLGGMLAFAQQRRAMRDAEQRVSFVNRVSHELRNPLTNIQLNADLAAEALNGSAPGVTRRIGLVRGESRRLGRLIDNVLTFSRSERGQLSLHAVPVVPDTVIDEVLEQFAPALERRSIAVTREGSASEEVLLDPDALAQILSNLVSNVEKYAASGKQLCIEAARDANGDLRIAVADAGTGIDERDASRIFQPFRRLDSRTSEGVSGTGLGLSIARDLAGRMGGTLEVQPRQGGATFVLRLPTITTGRSLVAE
ncbi:MAG: HAMP domain-containing histidine kinase [Verrucomicrobiae bacterium]|nr:HAMP domain-containing histidine kinase [Verrucomicrobiae bacterium]